MKINTEIAMSRLRRFAKDYLAGNPEPQGGFARLFDSATNRLFAKRLSNWRIETISTQLDFFGSLLRADAGGVSESMLSKVIEVASALNDEFSRVYNEAYDFQCLYSDGGSDMESALKQALSVVYEKLNEAQEMQEMGASGSCSLSVG